MADGIFTIFPLLIFVILAVVVRLLLASVKKGNQPGRRIPNDPKGYNREVNSIHNTTDAPTERRHRLEQLKSLYEAGMMEHDEYIERVNGVESDYLNMR